MILTTDGDKGHQEYGTCRACQRMLIIQIPRPARLRRSRSTLPPFGVPPSGGLTGQTAFGRLQAELQTVTPCSLGTAVSRSALGHVPHLKEVEFCALICVNVPS